MRRLEQVMKMACKMLGFPVPIINTAKDIYQLTKHLQELQ